LVCQLLIFYQNAQQYFPPPSHPSKTNGNSKGIVNLHSSFKKILVNSQ
jgi:hypothetical protein